MEANLNEGELSGKELDAASQKQKVWIANYAGHEFQKAEKFGKVKKITVGYISFNSLDRIKFQIANELTQTDPEDYLLISGAAIICTIAAIIWMGMHNKIKLLYWDKSADNGDGDYRVMIISQNNLAELLHVLGGEQSNNEPTEKHN